MSFRPRSCPRSRLLLIDTLEAFVKTQHHVLVRFVSPFSFCSSLTVITISRTQCVRSCRETKYFLFANCVEQYVDTRRSVGKKCSRLQECIVSLLATNDIFVRESVCQLRARHFFLLRKYHKLSAMCNSRTLVYLTAFYSSL